MSEPSSQKLQPAIDPEQVRGPLQRLYAELDAEIAALAPVCELSGRCCRFRAYDHTLFLSAPEAALLIADAPPPPRPLDDGDTCPWQDDRGRCTARSARPLGCRVYFCDPAYHGQAEPLTERYLARLRRLVEAMGLPWDYARLHQHLHDAVASGRLAIARAGEPRSPRDHPRDDASDLREVLDISLSGQ